jgi:transposase InsO family protein
MTSRPSPPRSTAAPAKRWAGKPRPKLSTSSYNQLTKAVLRRSLEPKQYTSIAFTERLAAAGVSASVGTVGDAYDNALAESVIGLFKTELIKPRRPWRTAEQVEIATLEYVDWFNHRRLYEACGDIPPAELEAAYYSHNTSLTEAG